MRRPWSSGRGACRASAGGRRRPSRHSANRQPASARSTRLLRPVRDSASRAAPSGAHPEWSTYSRPRLPPTRVTARARRRRRTHFRSKLQPAPSFQRGTRATTCHHLLPQQAYLNDALAYWHWAWRHVDPAQSEHTVPPVHGVVPRTARSIRGQTSFAMSSIERRASAGSIQSCPV